METYICGNVFVPLRSGPSHKSEMASQILFGEKYTIIDKSGSWLKIELTADKYSGWIDADHLLNSIDVDFASGHVLNRTLICYKNNNTKMVLEAGCEVYFPDFERKTFSLGKNIYTTESEFNTNYVSTSDSMSETSMKFINTPYLWGGRLPSGMDCSGFTKLIFKIHGITMPHDSRMQAEMGKNIDFIDEAESGDLVFFDNARGKIAHVGMILSRGLVIHESGIVRIDSIDHQGIYKQETGGYSHHLRMIRRMAI